MVWGSKLRVSSCPCQGVFSGQRTTLDDVLVKIGHEGLHGKKCKIPLTRNEPKLDLSLKFGFHLGVYFSCGMVSKIREDSNAHLRVASFSHTLDLGSRPQCKFLGHKVFTLG